MNVDPPTEDPGLWSRYVGPGAGPGVQAVVGAALCAGLLLGAFSVVAPPLSACVLAVLTADLCGRLAAQLAGPAKRWTHRPGQTPSSQLRAAAAHVVHITLFVALFRDADLLRGGFLLAALLLAAAAVLAAPIPLQRRVALAATVAVLLGLDAVAGLRPEAGWFEPLLVATVLVARMPAPATVGQEDPPVAAE